MGNLGYGVRTAFLKGLEALGKTASTLSDAAQHKLDKMNLENRRRTVLAEIPKCVMQLWKDGAELPEPLNSLLSELHDVELQLAALRPQPEAKPAENEAAEEENVEMLTEEATTEPVVEEEAAETPAEEAEEAEEPAPAEEN